MDNGWKKDISSVWDPPRTVGIDPKKLFLFLGLKGLSRTCIYRKYMIFMVKMSIKCLKIDWKMVW